MSQTPANPQLLDYRRQRGNIGMLRLFDRLTAGGSVAGAWTMVLLLTLLLIVVTRGGWSAIKQFGFGFTYSSGWNMVDDPPRHPLKFGGWPSIYGTLMSSLIAMVIAVPISLGCGIFLVKLAPKIRIPIPKVGGGFRWFSPRHAVVVAGFLIELLAAIPSIAFGLWARAILVPVMQDFVQPLISDNVILTKAPIFGAHLPEWYVGMHMSQWPLVGPWFENTGSGRNLVTSGIILAIMVTPIITAIVRDVLTVAPPELEQGALGLGATWWQATRLVLGVCRLGILGAVILGFARALGETMAVTLVIGDSAGKVNSSLFDSSKTISSLLADQFGSPTNELHLSALYYAAFLLLIITTLINTMARIMVMRVGKSTGRR